MKAILPIFMCSLFLISTSVLSAQEKTIKKENVVQNDINLSVTGQKPVNESISSAKEYKVKVVDEYKDYPMYVYTGDAKLDRKNFKDAVDQWRLNHPEELKKIQEKGIRINFEEKLIKAGISNPYGK